MINTKTISISSDTASITSVSPLSYVSDITTIEIDMSNIYNDKLIYRRLIDWGDRSPIQETLATPVKDYRVDSIIPEIIYGDFSNILYKDTSHVYVPSLSADVLSLTAQVLIEYMDTSTGLFYIPICIYSGSYYDSIGDLNIIHTNLIPISSNNINFVFSAEETDHIIEATT